MTVTESLALPGARVVAGQRKTKSRDKLAIQKKLDGVGGIFRRRMYMCNDGGVNERKRFARGQFSKNCQSLSPWWISLRETYEQDGDDKMETLTVKTRPNHVQQ